MLEIIHIVKRKARDCKPTKRIFGPIVPTVRNRFDASKPREVLTITDEHWLTCVHIRLCEKVIFNKPSYLDALSSFRSAKALA